MRLAGSARTRAPSIAALRSSRSFEGRSSAVAPYCAGSAGPRMSGCQQPHRASTWAACKGAASSAPRHDVHFVRLRPPREWRDSCVRGWAMRACRAQHSRAKVTRLALRRSRSVHARTEGLYWGRRWRSDAMAVLKLVDHQGGCPEMGQHQRCATHTGRGRCGNR